MGIPIEDDEPLEQTDDAPVSAVGMPPEAVAGADGSAADAADQMHEVTPGWRIGRRSRDPEVPDVDALDQAMSVPEDDDADA